MSGHPTISKSDPVRSNLVRVTNEDPARAGLETILLLRMRRKLSFLHHKGFNSKQFRLKFKLGIQTGKVSIFQRIQRG